MRRRPWTISLVSARFSDRVVGPAPRDRARCGKEPPLESDLLKYVVVYIDVNMYPSPLDPLGAPRRAARMARGVLFGLASLALAAACAPMPWQGPEGVDLPPLGIPGVFVYQRTGTPSAPRSRVRKTLRASNRFKEARVCEPPC